MKSYIVHLDYYLPKERITISTILCNDGLNERDLKKISQKLLGQVVSKETLIQSLEPMSSMLMGDRTMEGDIFVSMLSKMFETKKVCPSEISYIIYAHGNSVSAGDPWALHSEQKCINVPYFLQQTMGMTNAIVFNVEQECTSSFTALKIAKLLVEQNEAERILILSSNYFERDQKRLMGGSVFIGDGQGLMLVSAMPGSMEIIDVVGRTDGKIDSVNSFLESANQQTIVEVGCSLIHGLLQKHGLGFADVPIFVPLNTTPFVWTHYAKRLGMSLAKVFFENMGKGGHLGDVDLIRNLKDISAKEQFPDGYLVVYGVATGTSWNALLLKTHPLERRNRRCTYDQTVATVA